MSIAHAITQGGQIWSHRIRMFRQVFKIACLVSCSIGCLVLVFNLAQLDINLYLATWYYLKGFVLNFFGFKVSVSKEFWAKLTNEVFLYGTHVEVNAAKLVDLCERNHLIFMSAFEKRAAYASLISSYSLGGVLFLFSIKGWLSSRKKHLSNNKIISSFNAKWKIKLQRKASSISLSDVPLIKGTETQHILISGGTGSGKSNCLHHLLPQIRSQGNKAVIVDTTGVFVEKYYKEGRDSILNIFDERSKPWSPWVECQEPFDYKAMAESFIPSSLNEAENFWRRSAQQVLSSILEKTSDECLSSVLNQVILKDSLESFCNFLQGTQAASVVDISSEKTAASVRSVLAAHLSSFQFLKDAEESFSIRDWIKNDDEEGFLFLSCTPEQRESMVPFLSTWFSVAIRALSTLSPSFERRVWFIVDELPSLQRLKDLPKFVAEARKYGGCGVFSVQSPAQLDEIYGKNNSEVIVGNCGTKLAFFERSFETATRVSRVFGEGEVKESQESLSYGAHEMRDGVNLSYQKRMKPIVSAGDIQSIEANEAFLSLPASIPPVKIKFSIKKNCSN
jgi:type IV conjugative transfer system coupling protein TraD